ncbi:MAG: DciA family protein [Planctomycetota bacterium]|jgi:predicted nucleic acid-binding Zn ribbon protein
MSEPQPLSAAISELIARRGFARMQGNTQLAAIWKQVVGDERMAERTKVLGLKRGVLEIGVSNSALLNELVSFQKMVLLERLKSEHPEQNIKDIRFRLRSDLSKDSRDS